MNQNRLDMTAPAEEAEKARVLRSAVSEALPTSSPA